MPGVKYPLTCRQTSQNTVAGTGIKGTYFKGEKGAGRGREWEGEGRREEGSREESRLGDTHFSTLSAVTGDLFDCPCWPSADCIDRSHGFNCLTLNKTSLDNSECMTFKIGSISPF